MTRQNVATGQLYPSTIRDQSYAVLATAPPLPAGLTTEVALIWLMSGEYTVVHLTAKGRVLADDPLFTDQEAIAHDCFAYRTAETFDSSRARNDKRVRRSPPDCPSWC